MKYKRDRPRQIEERAPGVGTALMIPDTHSVYAHYLNKLKRNPVVHLDRVKFSVAKSKKVMMEEWWRTDQLIFDTRKRPSNTYWNHRMLPDILGGTRLNISGAYLKTELHNILNRFPNVPVINLYQLTLEHLEKIEILTDAGKAFQVSTPTEIEVRIDMTRDTVFFESLRFLSITEYPATLFFTKETARTAMKIYLKADHMRFEFVCRRRPVSIMLGTSKTIIQKLNLEACLKSRPTLHAMVWPRIKDASFFEDQDLDYESLFILSQPKNQHDMHRTAI